VSLPTFIKCPKCNEEVKFFLTLLPDRVGYMLSCSLCDTEIRPLPGWKFKDKTPKEMDKIPFPMGKKYLGVIISTMNRGEDIEYLRWVKESDMWGRLEYRVKDAITAQIEKYDRNKSYGLNLDESQLPEPKKAFNPLGDFKKKSSLDDLAI
jgi:hypothetical protein